MNAMDSNLILNKLDDLILQANTLTKHYEKKTEEKPEEKTKRINSTVNWLNEVKLILKLAVPNAEASVEAITKDFDPNESVLDFDAIVNILKLAKEITISNEMQAVISDTDKRLTNILTSHFIRTPYFYLQLSILTAMVVFAFYGIIKMEGLKIDIKADMQSELAQVRDQAGTASSQITSKSAEVGNALNETILKATQSKSELENVVNDTKNKIKDIDTQIKNIETKISKAIVIESKEHVKNVTADAKDWMKGELQKEVNDAKNKLQNNLVKETGELTAENLVKTGALDTSVKNLKESTATLNTNLVQLTTIKDNLKTEIETLSKKLAEAKKIAEDKELVAKIDKIAESVGMDKQFPWDIVGAYIVGGLALLGVIFRFLAWVRSRNSG